MSGKHFWNIFEACLENCWSIFGGVSREGSRSIFGTFFGIPHAPTFSRSLPIIIRTRLHVSLLFPLS